MTTNKWLCVFAAALEGSALFFVCGGAALSGIARARVTAFVSFLAAAEASALSAVFVAASEAAALFAVSGEAAFFISVPAARRTFVPRPVCAVTRTRPGAFVAASEGPAPAVSSGGLAALRLLRSPPPASITCFPLI